MLYTTFLLAIIGAHLESTSKYTQPPDENRKEP